MIVVIRSDSVVRSAVGPIVVIEGSNVSIATELEIVTACFQ